MTRHRSGWTLLELLVVLALIAGLTLLVLPAEQSFQHRLVQRTALSLLFRSCEEARTTATTKRLTTWLLLQHPTSGRDSFALLQEQESNVVSWIIPWKELPKEVCFAISPRSNNSLPETLLAKLPQHLLTTSDHLSGIAWNSEGSIVHPAERFILSLVTISNKKIGQILLFRNSGRVVLER